MGDFCLKTIKLKEGNAMYKPSPAVLCLVSFSPSRTMLLHPTKKEGKIIKRLQTIFADIKGRVDSVPGSFNLNQNFYETQTCLATSFGLMDFVTIPLFDSIWINLMYLTGKLDIQVSYIYNYDTDDIRYVPHQTFPDTEGMTRYEYTAERAEMFSDALTNMMLINNIYTEEDLM